MKEVTEKKIFDCIPEIDFNSGYRYFLGNIENYSRALLSILKSVKAKLPILKTMARTEEYEGLRMIAQTLRRMMSNIGAHGIADMAYQIEMSILNQENTVLGLQLSDYIDCLYEFSEKLEILLKKLDINNNSRNSEDQASFLNYDFTKTKESIKLSAGLLERKII
ncbi:hypothetical protein I5677_05675 [Mobilitalea sibirica]|uniref:Uncharacterized protein n=1 Tax=Mobilitalea sibirica TaxID=1462919 RepID=A0A8J7H8N1_9FIRM|nr:hypothetical protein [Mobilitalea sibirica]MBH1940385.1 hypothetical protein [Mobilitalea sibirica]